MRVNKGLAILDIVNSNLIEYVIFNYIICTYIQIKCIILLLFPTKQYLFIFSHECMRSVLKFLCLYVLI